MWCLPLPLSAAPVVGGVALPPADLEVAGVAGEGEVEDAGAETVEDDGAVFVAFGFAESAA